MSGDDNMLRGANAEKLEALIKKFADQAPAGEVPGQVSHFTNFHISNNIMVVV